MNTQTETPIAGLVNRIIQGFERIPYSLIAFIARFSIAAVFWLSLIHI